MTSFKSRLASRSTLLFCAASALMIVGCGGGGSSSPASAPAPSPVPAPVGLYVGTTSTNYELSLLVLENQSVWGVYGRTVGGTQYVYGLVQANGTASNGSYTATDGRDYFYDGTTTAGNINATYSTAGAFSGTVTAATGSLTFTTSKVASTYNYDAAAQISNVVGTWAGSTLNGAGTTVTVAANGGFTGSSSGCAFGGTLAPRASGKNVFDVSLTFANSTACLLPGATVTGIALAYPIAGSSLTQLIVGVQNAGRSVGSAFFAVR